MLCEKLKIINKNLNSGNIQKKIQDKKQKIIMV